MRKWISIVALGLLATIALGQAPAPEVKPKKAAEAKPLTLEEATAEAVRYHPDVRAAAAEVELAQAKLLQTKHNVAIKVATAKRAFENLKQQVVVEEKGHQNALVSFIRATEHIDKMKRLGNILADTELRQMQVALAQHEAKVVDSEKALVKLKGELANAEAEYASFANGSQKVRAEVDIAKFDIAWFHNLQVVYTPTSKISGSFANQLREAIDKPIKLEAQKKVYLEQVFTTLLKSANVTGIVRVPRVEKPTERTDAMKIDLPAGEHNLGTWVQMILDESNDQLVDGRPIEMLASNRYELFIREYGFLLTAAKNPPSDTITLGEYLKQVRAEKATTEKSK